MNASGKSDERSRHERRILSETEWDQIRQSLDGLQFGSVSITVQDGVVVQIDRTEKRRIRWNEKKYNQ